MKTIYKNIIIAITFMAIGTTLGYTYSNMRKQPASTSLGSKSNLEAKLTDTSNNTSNAALLDIMKYVPADNSNSVLPISSDVVIYNSHPEENYQSGIKVTDVSTLINYSLINEGLKSSFIVNNSNTGYANSYRVTHDLITKNITDYNNTILLDIHRNCTGNVKSDTKKIILVLAKDNPHFDANNKFAKQLVKEISKSHNITASIYYYNHSRQYFNQDLSNNSVLVQLGLDKSSDDDIKQCIDALVPALKNMAFFKDSITN